MPNSKPGNVDADLAKQACEQLVEAYTYGLFNGGSINWSDVDSAYELACAALGLPVNK